MHWISDTIALGNLEDALDHDALREAGISSILTLTPFPNLARSGFTWHAVPLHDGPGNSPDDIYAALSYLDVLVRTSPPVLVHCYEGKSRSVLIVALHLAQREGTTLAEAYQHIKSRRPVAEIDDTLWELGSELLETAG